MKKLLIFMVRAYKRGISPWLPPACRFHPSCSVYAIQCLETHPTARALHLIVSRLLRCQPFHPGGYDPVPPRR
ncbi:MAG TPA: membrane protein insertion efficiency factor YidD [bacterium]|nr:membrane protein insertion efficiency factor YidD [bacterium]